MSEQEMSKEELIKLLQKEDKLLEQEKDIVQKKSEEADYIKARLLKLEKAAEEQRLLEEQLQEEKNINLLQRYASEAKIHKTEITKHESEMDLIDKQIMELTNNSKDRVEKLADQFVELNKTKNKTLTELEFKARNDVEKDLQLLDKTYSNTFERNKNILDAELAKEQVTQNNISKLNQTADYTSTTVDGDTELIEE